MNCVRIPRALPIAVACLAALCMGAFSPVVAADIVEPATITRADNGAVLEVLVISANLDEVVYRMGEGPNTVDANLPRSRVKKIEYGPMLDADFARAQGDRNNGNEENAAKRFLTAAATSPYPRIREMAYLEAATSFMAVEKPAEALKALVELQTKAPRSMLLPQALRTKARIQLNQKDPTVEATIADLAKLSPVLATTMRAELLRSKDKPAEAAAQLQTIWGSAVTPTTPTDDALPGFAEIGFQLIEDLDKAGNVAAVRTTSETLAYSPVAKADQARAHRMLAESLAKEADKPSQIRAFDHALMAAGLSRNERGAAKRIGIALIAEFDKDPTMKTEVAEYRSYLNSL